jgi:hypothetical protein
LRSPPVSTQSWWESSRAASSPVIRGHSDVEDREVDVVLQGALHGVWLSLTLSTTRKSASALRMSRSPWRTIG